MISTITAVSTSFGSRQVSRSKSMPIGGIMKIACRAPMIRREAMLVLISIAGGPGGRAGIVQKKP
jgi:hypothetical protein